MSTVCTDLHAVARFAVANERHLASSPEDIVRTHVIRRLADPKARAADIIGEDTVHKFAEQQLAAVSQRPSRAELLVMLKAIMPSMSRTSLEFLPDDALAELAAAASNLVSQTSARGGAEAVSFADKLRAAWSAKHRCAA